MEWVHAQGVLTEECMNFLHGKVRAYGSRGHFSILHSGHTPRQVLLFYLVGSKEAKSRSWKTANLAKETVQGPPS